MPEGNTALHSTRYWGRTSYQDAWHRQSELVARRLTGGIGDTLVLTEHDPVFTHGQRAGALANLVWDAPRLEREGIAVLPTNRGGDITYHGPGQIVGYPIVCLEVRRDLHAYLRFLEDVLLATLDDWGLAGNRREGKTGIWLGARKIAAIGVAVRRWVAYHGFALNVDVNLAHFAGIVPCGISDSEGTVTSMHTELSRSIDLAAVRTSLAAHFWQQLPEFLAAKSSAPSNRSAPRPV